MYRLPQQQAKYITTENKSTTLSEKDHKGTSVLGTILFYMGLPSG